MQIQLQPENTDGALCLEKYDVIVIGAGPGGSTAARFAAEAGVSVLFIDSRREIGWPVQCGELLGEIDEMKRIFPLVENQEELFDIPSKYHSKDMDTISMFSPSMRRYDIPFLCYSTERRDYDKYLASLATSAGAELMTETRCTGIEDSAVHTTKGDFTAKVIIGADGPFSIVRKSLGLDGPEQLYPAISTTMPGNFGDAVEMYFGHVAPAGYAWIIPKEGGANVGLGADPGRTNEPVGHYAKRFISETASRYSTAPSRIIAGGWVPMSGPVHETVKGNAMLVGDAAGHVMATNGGGIQIAMICGRVAGRTAALHIKKGEPLQRYEREWRRIIGKDLETARRMMSYASVTFSSDLALSALFRIAGVGGLAKVIKCKSIFTLKSWR